ncbi:hypothetical protein [Nocardia sp. NPDC058666]|uniref:hypothetical protein n=1 Tax=unclassified Nocardia TaxID=2637762 RepID=UPI00364F5C3E
MTDDDLLSVVPGIALHDAATEFVRRCGDNIASARPIDIADKLHSVFQGAVVRPSPRRDGGPIDPHHQFMWVTEDGSAVDLRDERVVDIENGVVAESVRLTALQVSVVADLLRELAARLRPGAAFGLSSDGLTLAGFAEHLADDLSTRAGSRPSRTVTVSLDEWPSWLEDVERVPDSDLRNAVARMLDTLAEQGTSAEPIDEKSVVEAFDALAGVVEHAQPSGLPHGYDPGLFLRSVAGRTLFAEANDIRTRLAEEADRAESGAGVPGLVALTERVAVTAGILLKELAARLRPGITYGLLPMKSELGVIADDLAAELLAQTEYGRPTFHPGPTRLYIVAPDRLNPSVGNPGVMAPVDHLASADSVYIVPVHPISPESVREYQQLRESVLLLCGILDDPRGSGAELLAAAEAIHDRIRGEIGSASPADPSRHFLHFGTLTRNRTEPYGLTEFGAYVKESLADTSRTPYRPLLLSPVEAAVVADLLDELSARLRPGAAFGISTDGASLAAIVADAANSFRARTDFRRDACAVPAAAASPTRYRRLRSSAIRWLDTFDENWTGQLGDNDATTALLDLYLLARDRPFRSDPARAEPVRDPVLHLCSRVDRIDDGVHPVTLSEEAGAIESLLVTSSVDPASSALQWSGLAGVHVSSMLGELALRLRPGPAFGPSNNGIALADIAHRLSEQIWNQVSPGV